MLNKVWENEEYFTKREKEKMAGGAKRFHSLEATSRRGKEPLHNHRFDPAPMTTINTFH